MAAENLTAVVLAAIVSNYEKTMQKRRGFFRKHSLKIMHQLRRNAKKREALIFLYFRALGNQLFADRRFWVQETTKTHRILLGENDCALDGGHSLT